MSTEPDELFTLRTLFWIGNFQSAINEGSGLNKLNPSLVSERDEYIYRSYLSLGQHHIILSEIKDNSPKTTVGLRAIKVLASFLEDQSTRDIAVLQMKEWLEDGSANNNRTLQIIAATLFAHVDVREALRVLKKGSNMEQYAMLVQLYLRMDRLDLAQAQLKSMKAIDEDHTLSILASAWVSIATPGKAQDAAYIYDELIDKYSSTALLLNGLAAAKMQQGHFEEAETQLQEALQKAPSDPDTLANLISVSYHLQRPQNVVNRYLSQLKTKSPNHEMVSLMANFESAFDRTATALRVNIKEP